MRRADNSRRSQTIAGAIEAAGVPHVVLLSSVGAQQSDGTGPVIGLGDAETVFSRAKGDATYVRAAYFMENWGGALFGVAQGVLPSFLLADKAIPLVATRDIGIAAARLLFLHLADQGESEAAYELARTFDAQALTELGARGMGADRTRAVNWYERASETGSIKAAERLKTLASLSD